jgi:diguanylate cyclase (GGDEF)-like protein/PAS domain S-box-containing protein
MIERNSVELIPAERASRAFSSMVEHVSDYAIFLLDLNGIVLTWNNAAQQMKGYTVDEVVGQFFGMLYTNEDQQRGHPTHNLLLAAQNGTYQEETWRKKKDGSLFWALVEVIAIKDPDGEVSGFCKLTRDITVRKALRDQLTEQKQRAEVTLRAIGDAVISTDADGNIESLNPKAEQLTGWTTTDAIGRPFSEVFRLTNDPALDQHPGEHELTSMLRQAEVIATLSPAVLVARNGTQYAIEDAVAPIRLPDGRIAGGVIVFRDVTQSRQFLDAITHQATHDALTGLVNRIEFDHRLERSLDRAHHFHSAGALLYMDLDQFKIVNDTCGHAAGDALLKQLSNLYRDNIRDRDTLARLGGDEFALLADHCSMDEAYSIATKILQATRDFQFMFAGRAFKVGVSIGLACFDQHTGSAEEIVRRADSACYIAKEKGRNRICVEQTDRAGTAWRNGDNEWLTRLTEAMRLNQLQLHYQPIATTHGGSGGFHCEVLLRLPDPHHGVILPHEFLPAAERLDLMPTIDRWVVHRVLQWLDGNREHTLGVDLCAINLSGKTLADKAFVGDLEVFFNDYDIRPEKLCFEITETAALFDERRSLEVINGLREMGCKICVAGFGKGIGSFAYLKQLPADFIKIDGSLVSVMAESLVDEKMVTLMHEIAHMTGKKTIAEWVENAATAEVLSRIGIDYLQGHWIAYPNQLDQPFQEMH